MNAHPALNIMHYDGWILRFARGYSGRANSVNMLFPSTLPVEDKIQTCEKIYQKHRLTTIFKLTDGMSDLDTILEARGYNLGTPTTLMTLSADNLNFSPSSTVIEHEITKKWQEAYFRLVEISPDHIQTARDIQHNIQNKTLCATISDDNGDIIACGLCVLEQKYAGLFDIVVHKDYRRKGYGFDLCTALIREAVRSGADTIYLQVIRDNMNAVKMYEKIGFKPNYNYWYRTLPCLPEPHMSV